MWTRRACGSPATPRDPRRSGYDRGKFTEDPKRIAEMNAQYPDWDGVRENLLLGANGIAALTFFDVVIEK